MKCLYCGCLESKVVDSRPAEDGALIRRRRECEKCGKRFTTYEKVESLPLFVVKKDGRREPFSSEKIRSGLVKACEKRPVAVIAIDEAVAEIEKQAYATLEQEIASQTIGEMVMKKLKTLDEVAYVRFASVYRQFKDINAFMQELQSLLEE